VKGIEERYLKCGAGEKFLKAHGENTATNE